MVRNTPPLKRISLALQGGGAHGAFTWGVLDRLLQEERLEVSAISGSSAGAMNGAALKAGWVQGGAEGARENLNWLWGQLGAVHDLRMTSWLTGFMPDAGVISTMMEYSLPVTLAESVSRMTSPYSFGPFYQNPLTGIAEAFDFDRVCCDTGPHLFVGATNVRTGKIRVFSGEEVSTDVLLASACLPTLFKAVEIEDAKTGRMEAFWDGGYTGNPALFPLMGPEMSQDVLIVNINPLERDELPVTPQQINNRVNEISFNTSLLRELRAISEVQKGQGDETQTHFHMIADDALMNDLSVLTKIVPSPVILQRLKEAGQAAAQTFLEHHFDDIGRRSSVNLNEMFG